MLTYCILGLTMVSVISIIYDTVFYILECVVLLFAWSELVVGCVVVLQLRFDFPCIVSSFTWSELFFTACSVVFRLRFDFNVFFFKIQPVYLTSLLATNMAKKFLCCITQVRKLSWHYGLRNRKCISTTIDNFSLSIQSTLPSFHPVYSSVVPSNLILRIQFLQSHCYNTLHMHPNSSNIRRSIDRHPLPHHNRWKSSTNSTLKPLPFRVPFVFRSSMYPLHSLDT